MLSIAMVDHSFHDGSIFVQKGQLNSGVVNITKAFNSVPHEALLNLIKHLEASNNVLRSIQQLHEEPKATDHTRHNTILHV